MILAEVLERYDNAVDFYLKEMKIQGKSKSTLRNYSDALRYFRNFFAEIHEQDEDCNHPGYLDFQRWRDRMIDSGVSNASICEYMNKVRCFFGYVSGSEFEEERFYDRNPVPSRIIPKVNDYARRPYNEILTDEDVLKLWDNTVKRGIGIKARNWARNYAIVIILLTTELRNKELLDLKLSDIDFEYGEIQVHHGKGDKYRCVDMPEIAQIAVKIYLQSGLRPSGLSDDDYLFGTTSANGFSTNNRNCGWKRGTQPWLTALVTRHVRLVTGVDAIGTHDLRHVGARLDLHNGAEPIDLQYKLGHAKFETTQIYCGRLQQSRKRASAERVYRERDIQTERNKRMVV